MVGHEKQNFRRRHDSRLADDVSVVIRSSNERTADMCRQLLELQIPPENITTLKETPFSEALALSYKTGLKNGRKWTACIDADVLIAPTALAELHKRSRDWSSEIAGGQGRVFDKLFGGPRDGGMHWYRTSILPQALDALRVIPQTTRPETAVLNSLRTSGMKWRSEPVISGLHGYGQFYWDVFRAGAWQSYKHKRYIRYLQWHWKLNQGRDKDFEVALAGRRAVDVLTESAGTDTRHMADLLHSQFLKMGINEKPALTASPAQVSLFVSNHLGVTPSIFYTLYLGHSKASAAIRHYTDQGRSKGLVA